MKNLYSISGLLPAQFRNDIASNGIGWTTINPKQRPFIGIDPADKSDHTAISVRIDKQNNFVLLDETVPPSEVELCFREYQKQHQNRIDSKEPEYECLDCGDSGHSYPTLSNPDSEICECVKDNEINVGDWVQVLPDYRHTCGDKLNPGGIYVVRKIDNYGFKLSEQLAQSWISERWIKKIDFEVGTRVRAIGAVIPPGLDEDECEKVSGPGVVTEIRLTKDGKTFSYAVHLDEIDDFWWFGEGQFTLDD